MKTAVLVFGRMNPPTSGHEKVVNKVRSIAQKEKGDPFVYLSHTQDPKKDPLDYSTKIRIAQKAFGPVVKRTKSTTIIQVFQEIEAMGYTRVIFVVGSDRLSGMEFVKKANGKDYNFDEIKITSAGERDPDSNDVDGMSASRAREAVKTADNVDAEWVDSEGKARPSFRSGLPKAIQRDAEKIWKAVEKGLK